LGTPDGIGRFNQFQQGWIYWTPDTGAHEIHGAIGVQWAALGWERSYLGYPTVDEGAWTDPNGNPGRISSFEFGQIGWSGPGGILELPEIVDHRESIETPSGTALGGWAEVELHSDGVYCFRGGMHDSGFDNYSFAITGVVIAPDKSIALLLPEAGQVEGTASWTPWHDPQRQFDWPAGHFVQDPNNPLFPQYVPASPQEACLHSDDVRNNWRTLRNATIQIRHDYQPELIDELTGYLQSLVQNYKQELTDAGIGALVALAVA
jgi:LGFP repeat-containing protein